MCVYRVVRSHCNCGRETLLINTKEKKTGVPDSFILGNWTWWMPFSLDNSVGLFPPNEMDYYINHATCYPPPPPSYNTHTHTTKKNPSSSCPLKGQESKENFWFVIEEPWRVKKKRRPLAPYGKGFFLTSNYTQSEKPKWISDDVQRERERAK